MLMVEDPKLSCMASIKKRNDEWSYEELFSNYIILRKEPEEFRIEEDRVEDYFNRERIVAAQKKGEGSLALYEYKMNKSLLDALLAEKVQLKTVKLLSVGSIDPRSFPTLSKVFVSIQTLSLRNAFQMTKLT